MVFFTASLIAMVTCYVKIINKSYFAIIILSNNTILLSLSDTEQLYNAIKRQELSTVGSYLSEFHVLNIMRNNNG